MVKDSFSEVEFAQGMSFRDPSFRQNSSFNGYLLAFDVQSTLNTVVQYVEVVQHFIDIDEWGGWGSLANGSPGELLIP